MSRTLGPGSRLRFPSRRTPRTLVDVDQPAPPPPDSRKPRARPCDRRNAVGPCPPAAPALEPACRRARIEPAHSADVLPHVVQHVHERVPHFARRTQNARMIAVAPEAALAAERAVDRLRDATGEPAHTTLEVRWPVRFRQQVKMIPLDAEMQDAEALAARGGERVPRADEEPSVPEGGHTMACPQRHMGGTAPIVRGASPVGNRSASRRGLAPGTITSSAPRADQQVELLRGARHLKRADMYHKLASLSSIEHVPTSSGICF